MAGYSLRASRHVAFQQDPLHRPLGTRLGRPEPLRQGIDKNDPGDSPGLVLA